MGGRVVQTILMLVLLLTVILYSTVQSGEVESRLADNSASQTTQPQLHVRYSEYTPFNITIEEYSYIQAREPVKLNETPPVLAEIVELDVAANNSVVEFEFTVMEGESFLAVDGASLGHIEVTITIEYPDSTIEEYVTTAVQPLHRVIPEPPPGRYRVRLSITSAKTRAWIQVTTLSRGVATLDVMEKQFRYFYPGEARYIKFSSNLTDWILTYLRLTKGGYVVIELWKLPEMRRVVGEYVFHEYFNLIPFGTPYYHEAGEYVLCIRSIDHTDVSYTVATRHAVYYETSLDRGMTVGYVLPYDVELFWVDIPKDLEWVALDWSMESTGGYAYSKIVLVSPDNHVVYMGEGYQFWLNFWYYRYPRDGRYLIVTLGTSSTLTVLRVSSPRGVVDLTENQSLSLNVTFTQAGQAIYFRITSNYTFVVAVNSGVSYSRLSVISRDGWVQEDFTGWGLASLLGEQSILRSCGEDYVIRVQAPRGNLLLHVRSQDWVDHLVITPDHSDVYFRFPGDIVVLGVAMKNGRYIAQNYAGLNYTTFTNIWFVSPEGVVRLRGLIWESSAQLFILRYPYELPYLLNGVWRVVLVSNQPGSNIRVSQLQEGDEVYASTPYHEYHTFSFDYEIRGVKLQVPSSRWASIVSFNANQSGISLVVTMSEEMLILAYHSLGPYGIYKDFLTNIAGGQWVLLVIGSKDANVSVSIITHSDLVEVVKGLTTVTISYTETVTTTKTVTTLRTVTSTETLIRTVTQQNTEYVYIVITEPVYETTTVHEYVTVWQPETITLEYPVVRIETVYEFRTITQGPGREVGDITVVPGIELSTIILGLLLVLQIITIVLVSRRR